MPVLIENFSREGFAKEHLVPLAIGTSAASIVFTGISSARAHHAKEGVMWSIVVAMAPGIVIGSLLGPQIASALPPAWMAAVVAAPPARRPGARSARLAPAALAGRCRRGG